MDVWIATHTPEKCGQLVEELRASAALSLHPLPDYYQCLSRALNALQLISAVFSNLFTQIPNPIKSRRRAQSPYQHNGTQGPSCVVTDTSKIFDGIGGCTCLLGTCHHIAAAEGVHKVGGCSRLALSRSTHTISPFDPHVQNNRPSCFDPYRLSLVKTRLLAIGQNLRNHWAGAAVRATRFISIK